MPELKQRDHFFNALFKVAKIDKRVIVLTADCGAPSLDQWYEELPSQIINVGIAEQVMIMVAVGLALEGRRPFCYAIAPFATLRAYEFIKVDVCLMNLPVTIVGVGAGLSYTEAGPTHHTTEDISIMRVLPNMRIANPNPINGAAGFARVYNHPCYIRLDRQMEPRAPKIIYIKDGRENVYYPLWLKPFSLPTYILEADQLITVEEHLLAGGLGSIVAEYLIDNNIQIPLKRIGIDDEYFYKYGDRNDIWDSSELLMEVVNE